jgi:uncharacterized BrkB/YihY/UPF0761 family membrane protein
VWRFGTTAVFLVIVLAWFYLVALVILLGAELNAWRLERRRARRAALAATPDGSESQALADGSIGLAAGDAE